MATDSYKEYHSLIPNRHTELVRELVDNGADITAGTKTVTVYRTVAEDFNELFTHSTFDILYALDCEAQVEICGKKISVKKYSTLFIAPGVPYRVTVKGNGIMPVIATEKHTVYTHFHRISILGGVLSGFLADAIWGELTSDYLLFTALSSANTDSLVRMLICEESAGGPNSGFIKSQLLICMFSYLLSNSSAYELSKNKITRSEQISKILTFIQDNYRTVTLEKLAAHFHYTVPYVSKLIRSATGLTFTEILREIKFDVCRSLLLNSDLKINRIAEVAGFQNTDHFNRVFKKHMGITPTEFKKKKSIDK